MSQRRALAFFIASGLVFSALDAYVKAVVVHVPVVGALWARGLVFLVLLVMVSGRSRPRRLLRTASPRLQVARAFALFAASLTFWFSLSLLPLGEAVALGSASPLIIVVLAGPLLHEQVSRAAIVGAVVGFAGVIVLVGLDPREFDARALLPLLSSMSYAVFSILSRALGHESEDVTLFYSGAIGLGLATLVLVVAWPGGEVSITDWLAAGLAGAMALAGHRLLATAYRHSDASDLAPFGYLGLVWGFVIGAFAFGEPIELVAVGGAAAIAIGGLIAIRGAVDETPEMAMAAPPGVDVGVLDGYVDDPDGEDDTNDDGHDDDQDRRSASGH